MEWNPKIKRAKAGVEMLIKKKRIRSIQNWEPINKRLLMITMEIFGRQIVIIGIYAPNEDSPATGKEQFMETLQQE